jgi:hypothetical protein
LIGHLVLRDIMWLMYWTEPERRQRRAMMRAGQCASPTRTKP